MPGTKSNKAVTTATALVESNNSPEIDAEWMKFMSRINRQMNCDTVDDDTISDDESVMSDVQPGSVVSPSVAVVIDDVSKVGGGGGGGGGKLKKSCISKKTQRRSYSFIDEECTAANGSVGDAAPNSANTVSLTGFGGSMPSVNGNIRKKFIHSFPTRRSSDHRKSVV